jgi:integrase
LSNEATALEEVKAPILALVNKMDLKEEKADFLEAYNQFLSVYKATRKASTVTKYETILNHLQNYAKAKKQKLSFANIDMNFYEGWTTYLIQEPKLTNNTIGKKISLFKTFMHWATDRGPNDKHDFKKFKAIHNTVDIITLTEQELFALLDLDLSGKPALERVRDVFCFGCFTGQRFSDVAGLRPEHIKEDMWHLHTQKTKDSIIVPLNDFALEILTKYIDQGKRLPVISNQSTNDHLKDLGKMAKINDPITITRYRGAEKIQKTEAKHKFIGTHTARRTFVTLSLEKGMRPETLMEITGHKDYKTFKKYIKITSKVKEAEMKRIRSRVPLMKAV